MHGWASDARCWEAWRSATEPRGWRWSTGERGYGELAPRVPSWPEGSAETQRLVIGHSLGPHLLPADVLGAADAVVLLASFATFVPPGRAGRRARAALAGMAACLGDEARARDMLTTFMQRVAEPQSPDLLPPDFDPPDLLPPDLLPPDLLPPDFLECELKKEDQQLADQPFCSTREVSSANPVDPKLHQYRLGCH